MQRIPSAVVACLAVSIAALSVSAVTHRCIHDSPDIQSMMRTSVLRAAVAHEAAGRVPKSQARTFRAESREPIRITLDTSQLQNASVYCNATGDERATLLGSETKNCTDADVLTAAKLQILTEHVLPEAVAVLTSLLNVDRLSSLSVATGCASMPNIATGTEYANTDFALIVSAAPTPTGTLAWAITCETDPSTRRPTIGHANFGPAYIEWGDTGSYTNKNVVATAVHEILHAVGFTQSFIRNFFPGAPYTTATVEKRGKNVTLVNTTTVAQVTQDYFQCSSALGAELEDEGGAGSAGSHWDRRVLPGEMMAASGGVYLSNFTLAVLHDSGMYSANFASAEIPNIIFAKGAGCGFLDNSCNTTAGGGDEHFCFTQGLRGCSAGARAIGTCSIATRTTELDPLYQYFDDPFVGGLTFYDGCPVLAPVSLADMCSFNRSLTVQDTFVGNHYGTTSRCFVTSNTGASTGLIQDGVSLSGAVERCLEVRCPDGGSHIEFRPTGTTTWTACPSDGSAGNISAPTGFTGTVACPAASTMCSDPVLVQGASSATTTTVSSNVSTTSTTSTTTTIAATTASTAPTTTVFVATTETFGGAQTATPVPTLGAARVELQFRSTLALGQLTTSRLTTITNILADMYNVPAFRVSVNTYLGSSAISVLRFTVIFETGSDTLEANSLTTLQTALANASSALSVQSLPIANSAAAVVDCGSVCSAGTESAFRNADNTACTCTCRNQWNGTTCSNCAFIYSGTDCNQCAAGYAGYPSCFAIPNCTQPSPSRPVISESGACTSGMGSRANSAIRACTAESCRCLGGTYSVPTQSCFGASETDICVNRACAGAAETCLLRAKYTAMLASGGACVNDSAALVGAVPMLEAWCNFDLCVGTIECRTSQARTACSRSSALDVSPAAGRETTGLAVAVAVAVIVALGLH